VNPTLSANESQKKQGFQFDPSWPWDSCRGSLKPRHRNPGGTLSTSRAAARGTDAAGAPPPATNSVAVRGRSLTT